MADEPRRMVPFRLSGPDRERIRTIREHFGLPSDASAVRYAVQLTAESIHPSKPPRKRERPR